MDTNVAIGIATFAGTVAVGFWRISSDVAQIKLKVDLMWDVFLHAQEKGMLPGGERWYDPPPQPPPRPRMWQRTPRDPTTPR